MGFGPYLEKLMQSLVGDMPAVRDAAMPEQQDVQHLNELDSHMAALPARHRLDVAQLVHAYGDCKDRSGGVTHRHLNEANAGR